MDYPILSKELIEFLEAIYPDRCPSIDTPEREVWAAAGRAEVVRRLREEFERQQEDFLPECAKPS